MVHVNSLNLSPTLDAQPPQMQMHSTPSSRGSGSRPESASSEHTQEVYVEYLKHDIATEREVSFDNFMELILNRPDWSSKHSADVDQIAKDARFKGLLENYPTSGPETGYYHPFVELANCVLDKNNRNAHRIAFCRNDPTLIAGSFGQRKPDVIAALRRAIFDPNTRISPDSCSKKGPENCPFHWAELLAFAEFKKHGSASQPGSASASARSSSSHEASATGSKRSATRSDSDSSSKRSRTGLSNEDVKIQCASYALEMLSNGGLRTHVLGLFVAKDVLQLLYFDRSIFISSEPLNFRQNPREFIALLLILDRLTDLEWGFVPGFGPPFNIPPVTSQRFKRDNNLLLDKSITLTDGPTLKFGQILSRHHGLIGRGTCVIRASIGNPPTTVVAVKISSPASSRKSEVEILRTARGKATGEHGWVLSHLPEVLFNKDLDTDGNTPRKRLFDFFNDKDIYELRALRLIVFRELYPITELTTAAELAKALRGIFDCYRWLYEKAGILHRDISLYNLMYYRKEGGVVGVLNDFDFATFVGDPSPSSKQRTGTKPYMAYQLLAREGIVHRYRHDLESFFYVILILTSHFENGKEIANPPLQRWFLLNSQSLSEAKKSLLTSPPNERPSPIVSYVGFRHWLRPMALMFARGIMWMMENETDGNDSETLGDNVTFEKMANIFKIDVT